MHSLCQAQAPPRPSLCPSGRTCNASCKVGAAEEAAMEPPHISCGQAATHAMTMALPRKLLDTTLAYPVQHAHSALFGAPTNAEGASMLALLSSHESQTTRSGRVSKRRRHADQVGVCRVPCRFVHAHADTVCALQIPWDIAGNTAYSVAVLHRTLSQKIRKHVRPGVAQPLDTHTAHTTRSTRYNC